MYGILWRFLPLVLDAQLMQIQRVSCLGELVEFSFLPAISSYLLGCFRLARYAVFRLPVKLEIERSPSWSARPESQQVAFGTFLSFCWCSATVIFFLMLNWTCFDCEYTYRNDIVICWHSEPSMLTTEEAVSPKSVALTSSLSPRILWTHLAYSVGASSTTFQ